MSGRSKKWDDREKKFKKQSEGRASIFNWKILIFVGLVILLLSLMVGMAHPPAFAYTGDCKQDTWNQPEAMIICYVVSIYNQNEQIIEKLDWNNCVLLNKDTRYYDSGFWGMQHPSDLMDECGDMP